MIWRALGKVVPFWPILRSYVLKEDTLLYIRTVYVIWVLRIERFLGSRILWCDFMTPFLLLFRLDNVCICSLCIVSLRVLVYYFSTLFYAGEIFPFICWFKWKLCGSCQYSQMTYTHMYFTDIPGKLAMVQKFNSLCNVCLLSQTSRSLFDFTHFFFKSKTDSLRSKSRPMIQDLSNQMNLWILAQSACILQLLWCSMIWVFLDHWSCSRPSPRNAP